MNVFVFICTQDNVILYCSIDFSIDGACVGGTYIENIFIYSFGEVPCVCMCLCVCAWPVLQCELSCLCGPAALCLLSLTCTAVNDCLYV